MLGKPAPQHCELEQATLEALVGNSPIFRSIPLLTKHFHMFISDTVRFHCLKYLFIKA